MVILGLLLVIGVVGVSWTAIASNQGSFDGQAGTVELFGYTAQLTNGQVFLAGAAAGALLLMGLSLLLRGLARNANKRRATRRELRELRRDHTRAERPAKHRGEPVPEAAPSDEQLAGRR